jgi:hypothetical protein
LGIEGIKLRRISKLRGRKHKSLFAAINDEFNTKKGMYPLKTLEPLSEKVLPSVCEKEESR